MGRENLLVQINRVAIKAPEKLNTKISLFVCGIKSFSMKA